jgi:hypothetical protein
MSETLTIELTPKQRELLLRGLRFVRSSHMLEVGDPNADFVEQRRSSLQEVASLAERLEKAHSSQAAKL